MIISGLITLGISVAFWCCPPEFLWLGRYKLMFGKSIRFLFPDSPTTAWFLTNDERAITIRRIKVALDEAFKIFIVI